MTPEAVIPRVRLRILVGSGDRIALFSAPFVIVGFALAERYPSLFSTGGSPSIVKLLAGSVLAAGLLNWVWSVALILVHVPRKELITRGPYAVVKHPLYTGMALLVLPSLGVLLDSWLGAVIGAALYAGSRLFSPLEERALAKQFGAAWAEYGARVWLPWL